MSQTTWLQDRRMAKFADVLSRWQIKQLSAAEAGEILGMSERTFRRFRHRYEDEGEAGLADKRVGKASAKRVPVDRTQVQDSPDADTERPVSRQQETKIYDYYSWSPYWGNGSYMDIMGYGASWAVR